MKRNTLLTTLGLAAVMAATTALPAMARGDLQNDKNTMRNLALAGVAVAGYGLATHNTGATILGAAGAVLAGSQYENDRNRQNSWNNRWGWGRDYHRDGYQNWDNRGNGRDRDDRSYGNYGYGDRGRGNGGYDNGNHYGQRDHGDNGNHYGDRNHGDNGNHYGDRNHGGDGNHYGDRDHGGDRN